MIVMTSKPMQYLWHKFGEYDFANNDNLGLGFGRLVKQGIPSSHHYQFHFFRVPPGRKGEIMLALCFNSDFEYTGIWTPHPKSLRKRDLKQWEQEAITWLKNDGCLMEL